jgi:hypothetical protein
MNKPRGTRKETMYNNAIGRIARLVSTGLDGTISHLFHTGESSRYVKRRILKVNVKPANPIQSTPIRAAISALSVTSHLLGENLA